MNLNVSVSVDRDVDAAYLRLSDEPVMRTVEVGSGLLVDLDNYGMARGIELLDLSAPLPPAELNELVKKCHVPGCAYDLVMQILPAIPRVTASSSQTRHRQDAINSNRSTNVQARPLADC